VFLVHGERAAQDALAASFTAAGYHVQAPEPGTHVTR